jgi:hypothetical protein
MTMLRCDKCKKEVVIMGVSLGAAGDDDLAAFRDAMKKARKLVLFNPPPFGAHHCPACGSVLVGDA